MSQTTIRSQTSYGQESNKFSASLSEHQYQSQATDAHEETDADWRYNPDKIIAYYRYRPLQVIGRLINIVIPFAFLMLAIWWDKTTGKSLANSAKRAARLREILTKLGPAYIKVGQALSTRPDLVSPNYLNELTKLQDELPSFSNEIAFKFIQEELGASAEEIYAELSPQPMLLPHL